MLASDVAFGFSFGSAASDPPASDSAVAISLFHAKPALKKHGVDEIVVTKLQLVQWLGDSDDIEKWKECEVQEDLVLRTL